ncbi:putative beta-glucuronidase [Corticium candelabrum]|uniref:putative beta-glucuronidase n=1 Tax=Corticium candelabrum TaxID=121492 RepID=UPI002E255210|nr:putative beta-glucuronidase [Corticium candelabrum]
MNLGRLLLFLSSYSACSSMMCDHYPCYPSRRVHHLDGTWEFVFLNNIDDVSKFDPSAVVYNDTMVVPGSFDALPLYSGVRGTAVYRRKVAVTAKYLSRIKFEACSLYCAIFVDGKKLGDHGNGYSPFWLDVPASESPDREIVVVADNRFNSKLTPLHLENYDFYQYGGIARSVYLHEVGTTSISNVDVIIHDAMEGKVDLRVRIHGYDSVSQATFAVAFDGNLQGQTHNVEVSNGIAMIVGLSVPNHKLWFPRTPNLHFAEVTELSGLNDSIMVRFGIREVSACKDSHTGSMAVCINGQPTKLLGYSKHDMHPAFGISMPDQQLFEDIHMLRQLGGNYLRLVHYPHNPHLLDMCDELGILLWQELLGWGLSESIIINPAIKQDLLHDLDEMVNNTFNHPSVIIWAFLNEGASDHSDSCDTYKALSDRYKSLQVNGLVSWASSRTTHDKCYDSADVISFNSYPGWYGGSLKDVVPTILSEADFVAKLGKPFIKSEIGAGAIPGWQDPMNGVWTENYQSQVLERITTTVVNNSTIAGVSLWQFADTRSKPGISRPRTFNNKGTLDEYRRPKQPSFLTVQKAYTSFNHTENTLGTQKVGIVIHSW